MRRGRARHAVFLCGLEQHTGPCQMWTGIREQISPAILAVATLLTAFSLLFMLNGCVGGRGGSRGI